MRNIPLILIYSDKLRYRLIRHMALIASMILLFSLIMHAQKDSYSSFLNNVWQVSINAFFFFTYAYITTYILLPIFLINKKYFVFFLAFFSLGILISSLKFVFSDYIFYAAISAEFPDYFKVLDISHLLMNTKDMTFIVAIFLIVKIAKDNYYESIQLSELQDKQLEAEINLLNNQLNPHVLFNNLNNLYSISLNKPEEVELHLCKLNLLLNYYFYEGRRYEVLLKSELGAIENYIDLERLRYGDRLTMKYETEGEVNGLMIIPFILFPFVENCFEHGCSMETGQAWIKINIKICKGTIHFHVSNSKPDKVLLRDEDVVGCSIKNVRNKLDLVYSNRYQLCVYDEPSSYSVDLKLKHLRSGNIQN